MNAKEQALRAMLISDFAVNLVPDPTDCIGALTAALGALITSSAKDGRIDSVMGIVIEILKEGAANYQKNQGITVQ